MIRNATAGETRRRNWEKCDGKCPEWIDGAFRGQGAGEMHRGNDRNALAAHFRDGTGRNEIDFDGLWGQGSFRSAFRADAELG